MKHFALALILRPFSCHVKETDWHNFRWQHSWSGRVGTTAGFEWREVWWWARYYFDWRWLPGNDLDFFRRTFGQRWKSFLCKSIRRPWNCGLTVRFFVWWWLVTVHSTINFESLFKLFHKHWCNFVLQEKCTEIKISTFKEMNCSNSLFFILFLITKLKKSQKLLKLRFIINITMTAMIILLIYVIIQLRKKLVAEKYNFHLLTSTLMPTNFTKQKIAKTTLFFDLLPLKHCIWKTVNNINLSFCFKHILIMNVSNVMGFRRTI